jgi:hypothetical protein
VPLEDELEALPVPESLEDPELEEPGLAERIRSVAQYRFASLCHCMLEESRNSLCLTRGAPRSRDSSMTMAPLVIIEATVE